MAKQHRTDTSLCMGHVLYERYNILRRFSPLYERGGLGMPPLDFPMQRTSVSLDRQLRNYTKMFWKRAVDEKDINSQEQHYTPYLPVQSRPPFRLLVNSQHLLGSPEAGSTNLCQASSQQTLLV
ncbi:hypothetical protein CH063_09063 [Colletotrichum higginsianum]|uniref:Uncharacterized protein n=1 Tax=Colletotrichum higginsianum (strain IMI 349063) TaxID=759273 RepID=H1VC67_COLHI|nr:hypothetical protein CH063_09063 [Colletotrichum higginsianum]